ncbi:MAG: LamG domain-containing protein [Bacteroides sp.]|nr:LamG domain-containing protein [Bacteroides sp.]
MKHKKLFLLIFTIAIFFSGEQALWAQEINLEKDLLIYLPMTGNAQDESGNEVSTLIHYPKATDDRLGNPDRAYLFDGRDDYIALNNDHALITSKQFTICMWARIGGRSEAARSPSNSLFEQRVQINGNPVSIHFNGELNNETYIGVGSSTAQFGMVRVAYPGDDQWHHFLAMLDESGLLSIYINGKLMGSSMYQNDGNFVDGVTTVKIGSHTPENLNFGAFNGAIDEVYIYNRALKQCEIEALYSGQLLDER